MPARRGQLYDETRSCQQREYTSLCFASQQKLDVCPEYGIWSRRLQASWIVHKGITAAENPQSKRACDGETDGGSILAGYHTHFGSTNPSRLYASKCEVRVSSGA